MVNQGILIGTIIGVFFAGLGISYAVFSTTSDLTPMRFASQHGFDQMMSQNPRMSQQWMDSMMQDPQFLQTMMQNEEFMHEMMEEVMAQQGVMGDLMMGPGGMMGASPIEQHEEMLEMIEHIMEEEELRDHMLAHMIENQDFVHHMFSIMDQSPELKKHMEAHVTGNITEYETLESNKIQN